MKKTHRILCMLLSFCLAFSGAFESPLFSFAAAQPKTFEYYYLLVGVQFVTGEKYGSTVGPITESITIPNIDTFSDENKWITSESKNFKLKGAWGYFTAPSSIKSEIDEAWESNELIRSTGWTQDQFVENYRQFTSNGVQVVPKTGSSSGRNISYQYTAPMKSYETDFEVYEYLINNGKDALLKYLFDSPGLLGDETYFRSHYKGFSRDLDTACENFANPSYANKKLYIIFTPTIAKFSCDVLVDVADGTLEAGLAAPKSAKPNATFTVSDASILSDDIAYKTGVLERKVGDEPYTTVATWEGTGKKGENSGQSIEESFPSECTVTYRLTVTADSGQSDSCETIVTIEDKHDISVKAILDLPSWTYEGHPVIADDESELTIDGEYYSFERAREEGLASHSFKTDATDYSRKQWDISSYQFTFWKEGNYNVTLEVRADGRAEDTKPIEVRRCPDANVVLGGFQKQNRKQTLTAEVAVNPKYPVSKWWLEIKDRASGEEVTLDAAHLFAETANIKTRAVKETTSADGCFKYYTVEFLTKNPSWDYMVEKGNGANDDGSEPYSYAFYVEDSRGNSDREGKDFDVRPDAPPKAKVSVDAGFIRDQGTNNAQIEIEDLTTTDGDDLERSWSFDAADPASDNFTNSYTPVTLLSLGYKDMSFGSGQKIAFGKTGVGKVKIKLSVKDKWMEETLSEFVSDADYLTAEAEVESVVIDVAPIVSLEPIEYLKAGLYILTRADEDYREMKDMKAELSAALLEKGLIPSITVEQMKVVPNEEWGEEDKGKAERSLYNEKFKVGFTNGNSNDIITSKFYTADEDTVYILDGTWSGSYTKYGGTTYTVTAPFTVTARNLYTGDVKWQRVFTESDAVFGSISGYHPDINIPIAVDGNGKYLFLPAKGETLVLSRATGAILAKFKGDISEDVWATDEVVYYLKADGLYAFSGGSKATQVFSGNVLCNNSGYAQRGGSGRMAKREIIFCAVKDGKLYKARYNIDTGKVSFDAFSGLSGRDTVKGGSLIGMGSDGKILLSVEKYGENRIYYFDESGALVKTFELNALDGSTHRRILPAYNLDGTFEYLAILTSYYTNKKEKGYIAGTLYALAGDKEPITFNKDYKAGEWAYSPEKYDATSAIYATKDGDKVYVVGRGWWEYDQSKAGGYQSMRIPYYVMTFDIAGKTATFDTSNSASAGPRGLFIPEDDYLNSIYQNEYNMAGSFAISSTDSTLSDEDRERWLYVNQKSLSLDRLFEKFLKKGVTGDGADKRAVVIYDSHPEKVERWERMERSISAVTDSGNLLLVNETAGTSYLKDIENGVNMENGGAESFEDSESFVSKILGLFSAKEQSSKSVMVDASGGTTLSKRFFLSPFREYHYELKTDKSLTDGAFSVTSPLQADSDTSLLGGKTYRLAGDYYEDFEDKTLNPAFSGFNVGKIFSSYTTKKGNITLSGEGRYMFAYASSYYDSPGEKTVDLSLPKIPEGKAGILTLNMEYANSCSGEIAVYAEDGKQIDRAFFGTGKLAYRPKVLLPAGVNRVALTVYKHNYSQMVLFDDINLEVLEPVAKPLLTGSWDESLLQDASSAKSGKGTVFSGKFKTLGAGNPCFLRSVKGEPFSANAVNFASVLPVTYTGNESAAVKKTYIVPGDGFYQFDLYGPASDANGGFVSGEVNLKKGDTVEIFLGESAPKATDVRDGKAGENGGGYDDVKDMAFADLGSGKGEASRLSAVYINGRLAMVAGGGGANGNLGTGEETVIASSTSRITQKQGCRICGTKAVYAGNYSHVYTKIRNAGGPGGSGGTGGNTSVTSGKAGSYNSDESVINVAGCTYHTNDGVGKGGNGGSGGASYNGISSVAMKAGEADGASMVEIRKIPLFAEKRAEEPEKLKKTLYYSKYGDYYVYPGTQFTDTPSYFLNVPKGKITTFIDATVTAQGAESLMAAVERYGTGNSYGYQRPDISLDGKNITILSDGNSHVLSNLPAGARAFRGFYHWRTDNTSSGNSNPNAWKYTLFTDIRFSSVKGVFADAAAAGLLSGKDYYYNTASEEIFVRDIFYRDKAEESFAADTVPADVSLKLPSGKTGIADFSIYYIENGRKVYVMDSLADRSELSHWSLSDGASAQIVSVRDAAEKEPELPALTYQKGEWVDFKVNYSDYEADPAKCGFWIYAHEPYNDGANAKAAIELSADGNVVKVAGVDVAKITNVEPAEGSNESAYSAMTQSELQNLTAAQWAEVIKKVVSGELAYIEYSEGTECVYFIDKYTLQTENNYVLKSGIHKFYEDGKYYAYYFAYDDTSRGKNEEVPVGGSALDAGYPLYDKPSNLAEIPFYILGEMASAPWIVNISTNPSPAKADNPTTIKVQIDDNEKDECSLTTEVYKERRLIFTDRKKNIKATGGVYPVQETAAFAAEEGSYQVVCTVRDKTGAGIGSYKFIVTVDAKIEGMVSHTEMWESKREAFNIAKFGKTTEAETGFADYEEAKNPRMRYRNVFWPGEKFVLTAEVSGKPVKVTASIPEMAGKVRVVTLKAAGRSSEVAGRAGAAGAGGFGGSDAPAAFGDFGDFGGSGALGHFGGFGGRIYEGAMWQPDFSHIFGVSRPKPLTVVFTAYYAGGKTKSFAAPVIVDGSSAQSLLHRIL